MTLILQRMSYDQQSQKGINIKISKLPGIFMFQDWPKENHCTRRGCSVHCLRYCSFVPARPEKYR